MEEQKQKRRPSERRAKHCPDDGASEDMVMLAAALAVQLARGRTDCELEILINIVDLLQDTLLAILTQRRISDRQFLGIIQGDSGFII